MEMIATRLQAIRSELPPEVRLLAVSKYYPAEAVRAAYDAGQRCFGESRWRELLTKRETLPDDIEWHYIGHLQRGNVKYIAPFVQLIHAIDTPRLLAEVSHQAQRCQRTIRCLLQLHVAEEETKFGFSVDDAEAYLSSGEWRALPGVQLAGVMCMASHTDDTQRIRRDFRRAYDFFRHARNTYFPGDDAFSIRSWGMSGDYPIAIEEGSNMVRIGSAIFSE